MSFDYKCVSKCSCFPEGKVNRIDYICLTIHFVAALWVKEYNGYLGQGRTGLVPLLDSEFKERRMF